MKVALVLERLDWRKGGLESWTWQFTQLLKNNEIDVHVVAFGFHPSVSELGITAHAVGTMPRSRLKRAEALEHYLRMQQFDVIHDLGVGWHADIFHLQGGSPLATFQHNLLRIPRWRRFSFWKPKRHRELHEIERRQYARPGALAIAVSNMVKTHLQTLHHLPDDKMRVIYNGVDLQKFSPDYRAEHRQRLRSQLGLRNEVLFFMLARNPRLKNADTLIRATAHLAKQGKPVHLVIAGSDKNAPYLRLAVKSGAAACVTLPGSVDTMPYFAAADVGVLPTWYDPCSLFTLETWASGLPVITTRFNGASELMTQGVHGYTVDDPADHLALAEKMALMLDDAAREKMNAAARELALEHSFEKQAGEFIALYREIHAKKQGVGGG